MSISSLPVAKIQDLAGRLPFLKKWLKSGLAAVGLDVGAHSIKAVHLARSGNVFTLVGHALVPVPSEAQPALRPQAIQEALNSLGAPKRPLFTGVAGPGTVVRMVTVPRMTAEELKTALTFEAEKYIPFKLEEAFIDSVILGEISNGRMEILLAASRKEMVTARVELLGAAGTVPSGVDLEPVALANAWGISPPEGLDDEPVGLVHLGARATIFVFMTGGKLEFTREIPVAGEAFTRVVAAALQVDAAEAERIKCDPAERLSAVRAALQPSWDEWLNPCRDSLDFYESQFGRKISRLYLSGGSASLAGFGDWLQEAAGLPVGRWDPLSGIKSSMDPQQAESVGPRLSVAIGLAVARLMG